MKLYGIKTPFKRIVTVRWNGQAFERGRVLTVGMIEKDDQPGYFKWSAYHDAHGGITTSISEARTLLLEYTKHAIKYGNYFTQIPK